MNVGKALTTAIASEQHDAFGERASSTVRAWQKHRTDVSIRGATLIQRGAVYEVEALCANRHRT
jgi:hypothetical protein